MDPQEVPLPMLAAALIFSLIAVTVTALMWIRWQRDQRIWAATQKTLQQQIGEQQTQALRLATVAERERIYRDLHDDLGARLLDLVYAAPTTELAEQGRRVLQQLRAIVADAQRPAATLLALLAELRHETEKRLASAQRELIWEQDPQIPDLALDQATTLHLLRIVREAVSNALRHADLQRLRIRSFIAADQFLCDISDDGAYDQSNIGAGTGTRSMQSRAQELGGDIAWHPGTWGGTKVTLRVPLKNPN